MLTAISTTAALSQTGNDEQAIQKVVATMESGWAQKKGDVFASVFADVHDYIVWNGYYFPNMTHDLNVRQHQALFDGPYKNYDIKLKIDKIKFLRPDLALVHVLGGGADKGQPAPENPGILISMIMEKKDGVWKIISFHNLDLEAFQDKATADRAPIPLNVMYATWYKK